MDFYSKLTREMVDINATGFLVDLDEQFDELNIKSPIEKIFFAFWENINRARSCQFGRTNPILISHHYKIGKYFVDFKVDFIASFVNHTYPFTYKQLEKIESNCPLWAIELDGHEWHEKTKQQVEKDKIRERFIVSQGYKLFRFSGSEIVKKPQKCVLEIYNPAEEILVNLFKYAYSLLK